MTYLIEVMLPTGPDTHALLARVRDELTEAFGGVTLHVNSPAEGLWDNDGEIDRDRIVVVEVMADELDTGWWASYRRELEARFKQEEIVVRATEVRRL